jgi:hypothetical protein
LYGCETGCCDPFLTAFRTHYAHRENLMKRSIAALCGMLMLSVAVNVTFGRPDYRAQFEESYKSSKIGEALKEAKCNVCHYGTAKKNRNDYGVALSKLLTKDNYDQLKNDKPALNKRIAEAIKKVAAEKSTSGKTFGELIEAGKLPGTPPADAK